MGIERSLRTGVVAAGLVVAVGSCAHPLRVVEPEASSGTSAISQLWIAPTDLTQRDLFYGPGGPSLVPKPGTYQFVKRDVTGASPGYDVRDAQGRLWSVKLGIEAQPEIVTSRLLWAVGFHQPALYYLEQWTLAGEDAGPKPAGRFRFEDPREEVVDDWSWFENPFVNTRQFRGLVAANLLLNQWDWKTSNNKIYATKESPQTSRRYVVRDLGASLGKTSQPLLLRLPGFIRAMQGTKNDLEGFESQGYVGVDEPGDIDFEYSGNYRDLTKHITADDVRWVCQLYAQLSDRQLNDAFRAGGYDQATTERYIKKIREKIAQGLALPTG